ncbi:hypothetical protein MJT46_009945 [Ovis ammon polii x Ovis aries]|nr:hypothetical protein MJT46_009945 [Ovis ammon polii x Ovis aries]
MPPAAEAQSPNRWVTTEVPKGLYWKVKCVMKKKEKERKQEDQEPSLDTNLSDSREAPLTHCCATLEAKEAVGSHHTQLSDRVVNSEVGKGQLSNHRKMEGAWIPGRGREKRIENTEPTLTLHLPERTCTCHPHLPKPFLARRHNLELDDSLLKMLTQKGSRGQVEQRTEREERRKEEKKDGEKLKEERKERTMDKCAVYCALE